MPAFVPADVLKKIGPELEHRIINNVDLVLVPQNKERMAYAYCEPSPPSGSVCFRPTILECLRMAPEW
jgi:hypothetical protein